MTATSSIPACRRHAVSVASLATRIDTIRGNPVTVESCTKCGMEKVRINGRTLVESRKTTTGISVAGMARFGKTDWVDVCPQCDAYALRIEFKAPTPFLCGDGVMRSVRDLDLNTRDFALSHLDFCGFCFTQAALDGAIYMASEDSPQTSDVEKLGESVLANPSRRLVLEFSEKVCEWGGSRRVWRNLKPVGMDDKLAVALLAWFASVEDADTDDEAIRPGVAIHGLAISFASKHLRMLRPDRFAVLDAVLSEGLGFALNPKGYAFYMRSLRAFRESISFTGSIATLESGIFSLVRQHVSATAPIEPFHDRRNGASR
jgi:hypothetical protein